MFVNFKLSYRAKFTMPFLKVKKYLVFFSLSLYHLALHLKIAPWVRHRIICSNSLLHDSSCSAKLNFCIALVEELSSSHSRKAILFSKSCSLSVVLRFLAAAKLRDFSRTLSLIISQRRAGFIDSSFLYSSCVCAIVCFISSMHSVSDRSDV